MKHDLLHDYFERDLSAAEEGHLEKLLRESPEAAERFASLAAAEYQASGFPSPRWPRSISGAKPYIWLALQILAAGGLGFWAWHCSQSRPAVPASVEAPQVLSQEAMREADGGDTYAQPQPRRHRPAPAARAVRPQDPEVGQAQIPAPLALAPRPARLDVGVESGNHFKMVVELGRNSSVDLGVMDASGVQKRSLYRGNLYAGRWSFEWDGRLSGGLKARPGRYKVTLNTGKENVTRWLEIEKVEIQGINAPTRRP